MHKNLIGQTRLGYTITEELGSGAFGVVYKAVKTNPTGTYIRALKVISVPTEEQYYTVLNAMGGDTEKTDNYFENVLNNIIGEVQILNDFSESNIPNVVRYYENDVEVLDNPRRYNIYILMEYLTPLPQYIAENDFKVKDVLYLALDVLDGLASSHKHGVIHRDVKIDNIFVNQYDEEFKIGDFGVSKILDGASKAESLKGTPDYLAPEVYLGQGGYNNSVDLYSLGIVLYRLLNHNRNPFMPPYPEQFLLEDEDLAFERRMRGETPPMPALGGKEVGEVILKAISTPENRFNSALDFYDALEIAAYKTPEEELNQDIGFTGLTAKIPSIEISDETVKDLGSDAGYDTRAIFEESEVENNNVNQNLFDTTTKGVAPPNLDQTAATLPDNERIFNPVSSPAQPQAVSALPPVKKRGWIWVLVLLLLIALAAGGYFLYQYLKDNNSTGPLASPTYTVNGGEYASPQNVQIQTVNPDLDIFYTTDGSDPTSSSTKYSPGEEIRISQTTTLKSIAVDKNGKASPITSVTYSISEEESEEYITEDEANAKAKQNSNTTTADTDSNSKSSSSSSSASNSPFNLKASLSSWDFRNQFMLNNFAATASSTLPAYGDITYVPSNALDNDSKTAWSENVSGAVGIGESITLTYEGSEPFSFNEINFLDGYTKDDETYNKNTTPTQLEVLRNGDYIGDIHLINTPDPQKVVLPYTITLEDGDNITFIIRDAVSGPNDNVYDTNISEIRFS